MPKRKICVVTGTRADYGLLYWLMKEIKNDKDLELQIVATGMHLSPEFGLTYKAIEDDGLVINEKIEMLLSSDSTVGIAKSIGLGVISFAEAFERLKPNIIVVLGDRYEILAATQAALIARIPTAHIHGGELTEGLIDEAIRHSITKMSQVHFVSNEIYRKRVIQLGEQPVNVYNFGAPGLDQIRRINLLTKEELEGQLNFKFNQTSFLVTYHPVTLKQNVEQSVTELLKALDRFPNSRIIFTKSNSDTSGRIINHLIEEYVGKHPNRMKVFTSLGQLRYLSCIQYVDAVIGNSSSGLLEVPLFKKPTINIGDRQSGRESGESVIHCEENQHSIVEAINLALSASFQNNLKNVRSIYGEGDTSPKIKKILKNIELKDIVIKRFYDLEVK